MKYLHEELYDKVCTINALEEDNRNWMTAYESYKKEYKKIKDFLPVKFTEYYEICYFHDSTIIVFEVDSSDIFHFSIRFKWVDSYGKKEYIIKYNDVVYWHCEGGISYNSLDTQYLYGEILKNGKFFTHEFIMGSGMKFYIKFRYMEFID